jgi:hypothetical protein
MLRRSPLTRKTPMRHKRTEAPAVSHEIHPMALKPVERAGVYAKCGDGAVAVPKDAPKRSTKLRQSAKGEDCLVRLPGCPGDPAMTIWSHYRGGAGGKGTGIKASDVCGCFACTWCDAVYDGQTPRPDGMTKDEVDLAWHEGHIRSLVRLQQKGLL